MTTNGCPNQKSGRARKPTTMLKPSKSDSFCPDSTSTGQILAMDRTSSPSSAPLVPPTVVGALPPPLTTNVATLSNLMVAPCGDPGLPLRDSRYAYNSRSHDQYSVSPHNRADIKVTSSITVLNIIVLQLVTWPRLILPRRASLQLSSEYQAALMTHVMPTIL
jgi:hypothetical protein